MSTQTTPSATPAAAGRGAPGLIPNLQILRFVAAAVVLFGHTVHEANPLDARFQDRYPGGLNYGAGVDVFFVISGIVMILAAGDRFGRPGETGRFWRARLVRIAPLYWLFTAAMVLAALAVPDRLDNGGLSLGRIVTSLSFIPWDDGTGAIRPILRLGWTLNYEVFFYALFGLALMVRQRTRALAGLVALFVALVALHPHVPDGWWPLVAWSDPIILEFLFGMAIGLVARRGLHLPTVAAAAVAVAGVAGWVAEPHLDLPRPVALGLPAAALCLAAALGPQVPTRQRGARGLMLLGAASYALYLVHPFTINVVLIPWESIVEGAPWAFVAVSVVVSTAASVAVHLWIEKPLLAQVRTRVLPETGRAQR